ncbi:MAG: PEGA domain-containing protein [bacterium]|nr:PEGA domain-containing protein [bacterium]
MRRSLLVLACWLLGSLIFSGCNLLEARSKAGLQVLTNDTSSSLFLDDQFLDKTPYIAKNLKPGTYTLRIQPDDPLLASYETSISLRQGLLTVVTWKPGATPEQSGGVIYEMEKMKGDGTELSVVSIPDGAIISIEGKEKEFAPFVFKDVVAGQRQFEVNLPSYDTQQHNLNVVAGHRMNITVKLAKSVVTEINMAPSSSTSAVATASGSVATSSAELSTRGASIAAQSVSSTATGGARVAVTGQRVKILPTNFSVAGEEVLRVRADANSAAAEVGFVKVGSEYAYSQTKNSWYNITFENKQGWVNGQYAQVVN